MSNLTVTEFIRRIGTVKVPYSEAAMVTLIVIPLSLVFMLLGGSGHAPKILFAPFYILIGPAGFLAPMSGLPALFFGIFGAYPLYLVYGLVFAHLSGNRPRACRNFIVIVIGVHIMTALYVFSR